MRSFHEMQTARSGRTAIRTFICSAILLVAVQSQICDAHTPRDLLLNPNASFEAPASLTEGQANADLDLLLYALRNAYAGSNYLESETFLKAKNKLLGFVRDGITPVQFKDRIDEMLWTFPDNHLEAVLKSKPSPLRQSFRRKGDAGPNAISDKSRYWQVRMDRKGGVDILYVSIVHFPSRKNKVWRGFIIQIKEKMKKSQMLVLDLRGNGGGDFYMGTKLAEICFGNKVPSVVARTVERQTPETIALTCNSIINANRMYERSGQPAPFDFEKLLKSKLQLLDKAEKGKLKTELVSANSNKKYEFSARRGYDKPIYILTDGASGSSSEITVDAFEFHPRLKKVGTNTAGTVHFGEAGILVLPNSRIEVGIPTAYLEYKDKRFVEKIGIKPDIAITPGQDAYDQAVEDFKGSQKESHN